MEQKRRKSLTPFYLMAFNLIKTFPSVSRYHRMNRKWLIIVTAHLFFHLSVGVDLIVFYRISQVALETIGVTLLKIMNMITIILWALANQVTSQTNDISSANILAQQKTISENSYLVLTCSTFGKKKQIQVTVYLCKGDLWIEKKQQKQDRYETTFTIHRVGLHHSGNYSCVYSTRDDLPPKVTKKREPIEIVVISNFLPADISVAAPSDVHEGDDVAFRCIVSGPLQTLGECQLIHSYLMRNETILQVQAFNVPGMEANFIIEGAVVRDSGHYSCVVLPSKCIQEGEKTLYGNNAVLVEVKETLIFRLIASFRVIALMILLGLGLCLWWINKQGIRT
ncbi:uncharacterized protein LOC117471294 isoform X2 [Trematomus bernacchii]|uniref:uncharacterized protein LOC117471294 isoform X2 n=1 Tax=Trematomus bernacchii TaxID=40690 RepID=UPI00146E55FE|nr:uncharacterized protein LOC117471294 isoform X2 [Trematomus bernacchii]